MADFERVREIKRKAQGRLMTIPGVQAVGIGGKIVDGQLTSDLAIMVFVAKKKSASELTPQELIPDEVNGVKTDVYESGIFRQLADDGTKYRDPLMSGSRLFAGGRTPDVRTTGFVFPGEGLGGIGTLGCFAKTGGPQPKAIGLTNWHVLGAPPHGEKTKLEVATNAPKFIFSGSNTPGTLVVASLAISAGDQRAFYTTKASDTLTTIASGLAAQINSLAISGVNATPNGNQVTVTFPGSGRQDCQIFGPHAENTWADIRASVTGTAITLKGKASKACAAWVVLNIGGVSPTHGVFVSIAAGDDGAAVAAGMVTTITARNLPGITATKTAGDPAIVNISGVQEVECDVSSDVRVGQPTNSFCSKCSKCCDDRIGTVIDARLDLDVALIQLDPKFVKTYRAEIQDIGAVRGIHDINTEAFGYPLKKRGQTTRVTTGTLLALDVDRDAVEGDPNPNPAWILYNRRFQGAFSIQGNFSDKGDSGSAVLNNDNEVVGQLFAAAPTATLATPIQAILSAFSFLNLTIETATTEGVDLTVPALAAPAAVSIETNTEPAEFVPAHVLRAQQDITAWPAGQHYSELVQRHIEEVQTLLNTNRRVAAAWHCNGGPQIVHSFMHMARSSEATLPAEIDGRPLSDCLAEIQNVLVRYASPEFAADLEQYGPPLAQFAGLNYPQALDLLQDMRGV